MESVWSDYFESLLWYGNLSHENPRRIKMFEILHNIEYRYSINRDENREADGRDLRYEYAALEDLTVEERGEFMDHWVSVFEVLLALAIRINDDYIGDPSDEHPEDFFLEMFENLGLDEIKNDRYAEDITESIVNKWLDREFDKDGFGSPFPLNRGIKDQRDVELWDQAMAYINENYD